MRVLICVVLLGCRPEAPAVADAGVSLGPPRSPIECPAGTSMKGRTPPEGNRVWCETPAGVSHGPFLSWHREGQKKTEGFFDDGAASGRWRSWHSNGQLRSQGRYEAGERVGTWQRYDRDGNALDALPETKVEIEPVRPRHIIGVAECDHFLERYTECIETKAPEAVRPQMLAAIEATVEAWKQAASTKEGIASLAVACKAALDAVEGATKQWGCEY